MGRVTTGSDHEQLGALGNRLSVHGTGFHQLPQRLV